MGEMDSINVLSVAAYIISFVSFIISGILAFRMIDLRCEFNKLIKKEKERGENEKRKIEREKEYQDILREIRKEIEK